MAELPLPDPALYVAPPFGDPADLFATWTRKVSRIAECDYVVHGSLVRRGLLGTSFRSGPATRI